MRSNAKAIETFNKRKRYKPHKYPKSLNGRPRTHGGYGYMRFGVVPVGKERVLRWADSIACELLQDLGGQEQVSTAQLLLIREVRELETVKMLIAEHVMARGLFIGDELQPAMTLFLGVSNAIQRGLERLGLKRIPKSEMDLQTYIDRKYPKETQASSGQRGGNSQEAQGGTISESIDQQGGKGDESQAAPAALEDGAMGEGEPESEDEP